MGLTGVRFLNTHNGNYYERAFKRYTLEASTTGDFAGEEVELSKGTGTIETTSSWYTYTTDTPIEAKFIRFNVTDYHTYGGGLNELEIYGIE